MKDQNKNEVTREPGQPARPENSASAPTAGGGDLTIALNPVDGTGTGPQEKSKSNTEPARTEPGTEDPKIPDAPAPHPALAEGNIDPAFADTLEFDRGAHPQAVEDPRADLRATLDVPAPSLSDRKTRSGGNDPTVSVEADREVPGERQRIANYEILGELGRGSMGVVYKARQLGLNRLVALKMVLAGAHADREQLARFSLEAEAVAGLHHPNIVQIYEVGAHDDLPYFSLEYLDGGSLAAKLEGKPQPPGEAARILETLASAMACAHKQGIIHRDLKPANVLLTREGVLKITDFGLAKRLEGASSQTKSGSLLGTPSYMAPEQASGQSAEVGPLSDQYALGAVLYEMLTGRPPLVGTTMLETLELVKNKDPLPPSQLQPGVPRDLETICLKCLQKEPARRYASTEALIEDLHHFLAGEPIRARPISHPERAWRWCKRNPKIAALCAVIALLLLTAGTALSALWINRARAERATQERAARDQQAIDETRKLTGDRLEQACAAISTGDIQRAGTLLISTDPLLESAEQLQELRAQLAMLRGQIEVYGEFKKLLDNARFASRFGSLHQKELAQKYCRDLIELDEQLRERTGRGAVGLPPLDAEQQKLFQEDRFEVYLIAAMLELDLASNAAPAAKEQAARRALEWLNRADQVLPGLRVTYVNRAQCRGILGLKAESEADVKRAQATKPTSAIDHFWHGYAHHLRAIAARQKGDLKGAQDFYRQEIAEYAALLELRPDHFWGYFNWANTQVELGNLRDAVIGYTACTRIRPDFPWPYNNRATIHLNLREFEQALQDYNTALRHNPDYAEAYASRGLVHFKLGRPDPALADMQRAIALNPDYTATYEYRAEVYAQQKKYPEALADYQRLLGLSSDKRAVYLKMADVHHAMGNCEAAVNDCTQALAANPKNANTLYKRAGFQVVCKKYVQAVQDYSAVLDLVPKALEPRQDRAKVNWLFLKDFDASLADWEELTKLYPKNPESYFGIGAIKLGRRQYDEAQAALEKAIELKLDYTVDTLAQVVYWKGDPEGALKVINPLAEKLPAQYPETLNVRGDIYRALGRLDDAARDYQRLIALKPELVETYVSLALVYEKQGKPELAKECFEKLVAANPNSAPAYLRRGVYRRTRGEFEAAREDCVRARAKDPKSLLPDLVEASILAARGSAEDAVAKAEALLARAPKGDGQILYTAACTWSLASRTVAALPDKAKAAELTKQYADRAADLLAECLDKGFHDLSYPEHNRMADDPALEPIRNDPRVRKLVTHRP
jgi:tetratricopeptide (TPR) repeat protein/tRNA A-37 threonylcarbamoyl transferase component Bud32